MLKDNIDINARLNFTNSYYCGTSILIIPLVTEDNTDLDFWKVDILQDVSLKSRRLLPLPQEYINVKKLLPEESSTKKQAMGTSLLN